MSPLCRKKARGEVGDAKRGGALWSPPPPPAALPKELLFGSNLPPQVLPVSFCPVSTPLVSSRRRKALVALFARVPGYRDGARKMLLNGMKIM